jgi:hypothetical protein
MLSLKTDLERLQQKTTEENEQAIEDEWFRQHIDLDCRANRKLLREYMGSEVPVTKDNLDVARNMLGDRLAVKSDSEVARILNREAAELAAALEAEHKALVAEIFDPK